jgi:myosin-18
VDGLCEQLRRSKIHFVHCFLPQHNAGLCDVRGSMLKKHNSDEIAMNVPLIRSQVREPVPNVRH